MKNLHLTIIFTLSLLLFTKVNAQTYDVAFDQVSWNNSHGDMTINVDTATIVGQSGISKSWTYTLNVDPSIEDLYFTAHLYLENIVPGPAGWDVPKMRIESTGGAKLINWNISNPVEGKWVHTGIKIDNFDNLGINQIVLILRMQNCTGTMRIIDPFVSSSPATGTYSFPFDVPADPSVNLNVNTSQYHTFQNDILSTNCHFTWAPYNWDDQNVKDIIYEKFPMKNLRFPGGTVANFYNWQTDDFYANSYSANNNTAWNGSQDAKVFGYPGYVDVARTLGGSSTLLFNVFSDDETLTKNRLLDRLNDNLNIKWIEMGNENYFGEQAYGYVDDTETGLHGNNDGEDYDEYITHTKDIAMWLKQVKPDIKVAVNTHDSHWNTPLAAENYYDACVVHNYIMDASFMLNEYGTANFFRAYKNTQNVCDNFVSEFGSKPMIMSEWGLLSDVPASFMQVIATADNFLSIERGNERGIVQQAGIHMLYHGNFIGEASMIMHDGTEMRLNPVGVVYSKLYEVFQDHNVYDAYSTSAELQSDLDGVHAKAVDLGDSVYVFVVNKLPVASPLNLQFDGVPYSGTYSMESYTENMDVQLTWNYSMTDNPWVKSSGSGIVSIPANSISIVTIQKDQFQSLCVAPDLGGNTDLCGGGSVNLNSQLNTNGKTFSWYQDNTLLSAETGNSMVANTAGTYKVIVDSAGCIREDIIEVYDAVYPFYLGGDLDLCNTTSVTLDANLANPNVTYNWTKDGSPVTEATGQLYVSTPGVYALNVTASGCADQSDTIVITSGLVDVTYDTLCNPGTANLTINTPGSYEWYANPTGGAPLSTSLTYSPSIPSSTTYYVQDNNTADYNLGKTTQDGTIWGGTTDYDLWGRHYRWIVEEDITINNFDIFTNDVVNLQININGTGGNFVYNQNGIPNMGNTPVTIPINMFIPAGDYTVDLIGTIGRVDVQVSNQGSNTVPDVITFEGVDDTDHYGFFYNWDISVASSCDRTPVEAVVDPGNPNCVVSGVESKSNGIQIYPNPTSGIVHFSKSADYSLQDILGQSLLSGNGKQLDISRFGAGTYFLRIDDSVLKIIKE